MSVFKILSMTDYQKRLLVHSEGVFGFADFKFAIPWEAIVQNMILYHLKPGTGEQDENAQTSIIFRN